MRTIRLLISAAETSSDLHGARLLRAIKASLPADTQLEAYGIGGPHLKREGLEIVVDAKQLLAMGFLEIVGHLPRIFKALRALVREARLRKPDLAIVIDYPDFHFRLAKKLKSAGIPIVYYIPPKVWAWRTGRVRILAERFKRILCILPFEKDFYSRFGIPVTYVGNPLCDELPLELTRAEARRKLGLAADDRVLLIMPGSRKSELKRQLKLVLEASLQIAQRPSLNSLKVLLPLPETADLEAVRAEVQEWRRRRGDAVPEIRISQGDSSIAMVAADVGMIKSGTSTLEAGLLGCGHVLFYKANWLSEFIYFKFIRYGGPVGLVNLVWGKGPETERPFLVTELLGKALTVGSLVRETAKLLEDPQPRETMRAGLAHLREKMLGDLKGQSPSQRAAQTILDELGRA